MYWVQISQETDEPVIHFYSHPRGNCWDFHLEEALEVLEVAKKKLLD
jgi:hypothetical protein